MSVRILLGDVRRRIKEIPDGSVHVAMTSPPFLWLRNYQTAVWTGGVPGCDHRPANLKVGRCEKRQKLGDGYATHATQLMALGKRVVCEKCGATKVDRQIGLEATVDDYVSAIVDVFREVRRVLHPSGTLWVNLGSTYNPRRDGAVSYSLGGSPVRVKRKDMIPVPWIVAMALQQDGWYLRSDVIYSKSNVMPSSVKDRPTMSHEYVLLFSKSVDYYYDSDAVRDLSIRAGEIVKLGEKSFSKGQADGAGRVRSGNALKDTYVVPQTRNLRSVWTLATEPTKYQHYASFPTKLVEPCVKAGSSEKGCCPICFAPWTRIVKASGGFIGQSWHDHSADALRGNLKGGNPKDLTYKRETVGWKPGCDHGKEPVPCTVLDPFGGIGTVGLVAARLNRNAILIELKQEYAEISRERILVDLDNGAKKWGADSPKSR